MPVETESAEDGSIEVSRSDHVAVITLNRPHKLNVLTLPMVEEFRTVTQELDGDPGIRALVITGAGRAFSAGGDLHSLLPAALAAGKDILNPEPTERFLSRVFTPVIAAVEGVCVGGGFEIMLGTDLRVAAADATFGLPENRWGLIAGSGSNVRLPRQVPWAIAMEILLVGSVLDAERARSVGLVNDVVAPGGALDRAMEIAQQIAANGPVAARSAKEIAVRSAALADGFALEYELNARVLSSEDAREGVRAFQERRPARYSGR
jgi:enoyl-CoA hydratase/carnithine racemase